MSDKMQNESGQFDYTKWENVKNVVKMDYFFGFSDILDVFSGQNKDLDMIPSKLCQAVWLQKWLTKTHIWPEMANNLD